MRNLKLPELDLKILEEKAKEFAMQGAIKEIEEYYTGYSSPFREKIKEYFVNNGVSIHLDLPDIIGLINESLTIEIDRIANNSIAESFVPLATNALTRIEGDIKFSEILVEFVRCCNIDFKDSNSPQVSINESDYGWLDVEITFTDYRDNEIVYDLTLHTTMDKGKDKDKYYILSLPRSKTPCNYTKIMKLANCESTIEMPFTRDSLKDRFTSYIARIIISKSLIIMDCNDFTDLDEFI